MKGTYHGDRRLSRAGGMIEDGLPQDLIAENVVTAAKIAVTCRPYQLSRNIGLAAKPVEMALPIADFGGNLFVLNLYPVFLSHIIP